jgi:hypothetical protein
MDIVTTFKLRDVLNAVDLVTSRGFAQKNIPFVVNAVKTTRQLSATRRTNYSVLTVIAIMRAKNRK